MKTIKSCPCGERHHMSDRRFSQFAAGTAGKPDAVLWWSTYGAFRVPYIYIACHNVVASDLPVLADRYGWERVEWLSASGSIS